MPSRNIQAEREQQDEEKGELRSQDLGMDYLNAAQEMLALSRKRREGKRKAIKEDHLKRKLVLVNRINTLFETRNSKVSKIQKAQWDRLDALNKKRVCLESRIIAHMKTIELQTSNISNELAAMFEGRKQDILELQVT